MGSLASAKAHKNWLIVTAVVIAAFGPVFFLGTMDSTSEPARLTLDLLSWPVDQAQTYDDDTLRFLSALTGGFLFGWGVMILCLRAWAYDAAPDGVRTSVVVGLLAWFVLDSAGSLASGNPSNALFNVVVLLLAVGPLWRPARSGTPESAVTAP
jgi:biotin transporter BioY